MYMTFWITLEIKTFILYVCLYVIKLNKEAINATPSIIMSSGQSRSKLINWSWHVSYFIFFFRKISWSTCFGFRLALCAVTMSPAVEKTRSEETLVAGTVKYICANLPSSWKRDMFIFHQIRGLPFILRSSSSWNRSTSSMASWCAPLAGSTCVRYTSVRRVSSRHVGVFVALPSSSNWSTFTDSTGVSSAARLTAGSWGGVADVSGSTESADTVCSSWCVWLHRVCCRRCWLAGWVTPEAMLAAAWSVDGGFGVLFSCMLPLDRSCGWYLLRSKVAPNIGFAFRVCHNYNIVFHDDSLFTSSVQATVPRHAL